MPSKTVEFLSMRLTNKKTGDMLSPSEMQKIMEGIFQIHCLKNDDYKTLDLTPKIAPDSVEPKVLLDIYEMTNKMFGRVSKKKDHNSIVRRNYNTYKAEDVFTTDETRRLGIEVFTYFIVDFEYGIISIVNAKDAPGARVLNYIFDEYNNSYEIEFINIPNKDGVNLLYNSKTSAISGFEFEIPVPNAEYLEKILGLNEAEIVNIVNNNVHSAIISLKPEPYKDIESDPSKVKEIIDILKRKKGSYCKSIIKAKTDEFNTRNYDLHAKFFTYPIKIKKTQVIGGKKRSLSGTEMKQQFKVGLNNAYDKNKDLLIAIIGREG